MEESIQRDIDDTFPLDLCHARHRRIVVQTRIIDDDLNGSRFEEISKRLFRGSPFDNIERRGPRRSPVRDNFSRHLFSRLRMSVSMDNNGIPISCQPLANDSADGSASACHECTFFHHVPFTKIDARPSIIKHVPWITAKEYM